LEFVRRFPQEDITSLIQVVHVDGSIPTVESFDACCDALQAHQHMQAKRKQLQAA
jgi:hypothetical protein